MAESAITYATRRIMESIPREILQKAFTAQEEFFIGGMSNQRSLRSLIEDEVIRASLNRDLQALTSEEVTIPLGGLSVRYYDSYQIAINIPLQYTGGRVIQDVIRINYYEDFEGPQYIGANQSGNQINTYVLKANDILNSVSPAEITGTSRVRLVGPNTLLADVGSIAPSWMSAVVLVEPDVNMRDITPLMYEDYARLAVAKAKQLIYNKLVIRVNRGEIHAGVELGEFKNQIDRYSDMGDTYYDLMETWKSVQACANDGLHEKLIKMQMGSFKL